MLWCQSWCQKGQDAGTVGWSGGEVGLGVGIEHRHLNQTPRPLSVALPKDGFPLIHTVEGWRGRRGSSPTQNTVRPQSLLSTPFPMKKSKKGGSLWQDTHREQQRVCFFYLFLSLKEVKRRPGVNSSIPGWWCPLHEAAGAPELSGGVLCHSQNNQKKKINPGRRGVFLHGCALYVVPWWTHVLSLFILFFRTGRPSLPSAFTPPPAPPPPVLSAVEHCSCSS